MQAVDQDLQIGSLGPWSRVIAYCNKLTFCQNDPPIGESFWQKETLLQGPKDPVLPTLCVDATKHLNQFFFSLQHHKLSNIQLRLGSKSLTKKVFVMQFYSSFSFCVGENCYRKSLDIHRLCINPLLLNMIFSTWLLPG